MQLLINHLTRMQPGYICAAGIELKTGLHVRPVVAGGLTTSLLTSSGGTIQLGVTLDLGPTKFVGKTPEIEDREFDPSLIQVVEPVNRTKMIEHCARVAKTKLAEIFTTEISKNGSTYALTAHAGLYSLGCYWAISPKLEILSDFAGQTQRLKLAWRDEDQELSVGVADIRFYEADHRSLQRDRVAEAQAWLANSAYVLLSLGLSRPYRRSEKDQALHWLQVNNIHWG